LRPHMRTSFHHQPEAQHPKSSSYPQAGRPITPSLGGQADNICSFWAFPPLAQSGHRRDRNPAVQQSRLCYRLGGGTLGLTIPDKLLALADEAIE